MNIVNEENISHGKLIFGFLESFGNLVSFTPDTVDSYTRENYECSYHRETQFPVVQIVEF